MVNLIYRHYFGQNKTRNEIDLPTGRSYCLKFFLHNNNCYCNFVKTKWFATVTINSVRVLQESLCMRAAKKLKDSFFCTVS